MNRAQATGRRERVAWTIVDQGLSSLSNLGLGLFAAHTLGLAGFGAFSLVYTTYLLAIGCSRALCSFTIMSRSASQSSCESRKFTGEALGAMLVVSVPAAIACLLASMFAPALVAQCFLALAVCLPGLLLQDGVRFVFFASGRPALAALSDFAWTVGMGATFAILTLAATITPAILLLAWGLVGTLAGIASLVQVKVLPRLNNGLAWIRANFHLGGRYFLEFLADTGSVPVTTYALGAIVGVSAAGGFRGAQLVLGPLSLLFIGGRNAAISEGARMDKSDESVRRLAVQMTVGLTAVSLIYVSLLLAVPDVWGRTVMGDAWDAVDPLLLPLGLAWAVATPQFAGSSCLKVLQDSQRSLWASMWVLPMTLLGGIGGAVVDGAVGASYGLGLANLGAAVCWWHFLQRSLAARHTSAGAAPTVA